LTKVFVFKKKVNEWKMEQETRLAEARRWREAADIDIAATRATAQAEVNESDERRRAAEEERDILQTQLKEVQRTVLQLVGSSGDADSRATEALSEVQTRDRLIADLKQEVARLLAEATNQGACYLYQRVVLRPH
jgi:hypothetical protein